MKNILKIVVVFIGLIFTTTISAQERYFSKTGSISFFSQTPIEDIKAESNSASTVIDVSSGKIQWAVLIKSFQFEKSLMQEHFNENYMESSEFPKAKFSGTIENISSVEFTKEGSYDAQITGDLTIHGVTQPITSTAVFEVKDGTVSATSKLTVKVADYGIEIPAVVRTNIAEEIEITIKTDYQLLVR